MGKISFIHLSDIHFVKTSGNPADIDSDLRNAILTDIKKNGLSDLININGILVGGDIAFSGCKEEYKKAKDFLEEITEIFGIDKSSVYCVPGNHDVDQSIPQQSAQVYNTQCKLDEKATLDDTDKSFEEFINDKYYNDILFKTIKEYNEFSSRFECNINAEKINWKFDFKLDHDMKLRLHGINSIFISNADDHLIHKGDRLMYIGQSQIPQREDNTIIMTLCHHPPTDWKFLSVLQEKLNKRADIQLYGHKHDQTILLTDENIIITSGATHPSRGNDWTPRYNWISIECIMEEDKRLTKVRIHPRILDESRDRFVADYKHCVGGNYIEHVLPIDYKRDKDLSDVFDFNERDTNKNLEVKLEINNTDHDAVNLRTLVYDFFDLSFVKQTEILIDLDLLDEEDREENYSEIIVKIINKAKKNDKIDRFWERINSI